MNASLQSLFRIILNVRWRCNQTIYIFFGEAQAPGGRDLERERGERAVSSPCVSAVHSGLTSSSRRAEPTCGRCV